MKRQVNIIQLKRSLKLPKYKTAVDTCGYSSPENYRAIIKYTDMFLFDIKHLDNEKHIKYTGVPNTGILENLKLVLDSGTDVMVRIPVIPGVNDDIEHLDELRKFITGVKCNNLRKINLLPFHRIGASKYRKFNIPYRMNETEQPSLERMKELKEFFSETGIKVKVGG
jgi:pyruvate formate lyase activating enzyme